jgi:hypothetical protein
MKTDYTAVVTHVGLWWIGWIAEVPGVNCQESTHEERVNSLRATLREALELNKEDALAAAGADVQEEPIARYETTGVAATLA